jgi:hypothetical protein
MSNSLSQVAALAVPVPAAAGSVLREQERYGSRA